MGATQNKTREVRINKENRELNKKETLGDMRPLGSPSQLFSSHPLNSEGENTELGSSLAVEFSSTILGLEEEVLVKVHVSCFHEFEGAPSSWPDELEALKRIILKLVFNSPPYEVIM